MLAGGRPPHLLSALGIKVGGDHLHTGIGEEGGQRLLVHAEAERPQPRRSLPEHTHPKRLEAAQRKLVKLGPRQVQTP